MTIDINDDGTLPYLRDARGRTYLDPDTVADLIAVVGTGFDYVQATEPPDPVEGEVWLQITPSGVIFYIATEV